MVKGYSVIKNGNTNYTKEESNSFKKRKKLFLSDIKDQMNLLKKLINYKGVDYG